MHLYLILYHYHYHLLFHNFNQHLLCLFLTQDGRVCWFDLRCPDVPQLVMDVSVEPVSSICFKSGLFYLLVLISLFRLCFQLVMFSMNLSYPSCAPVLGKGGFYSEKESGIIFTF